MKWVFQEIDATELKIIDGGDCLSWAEVLAWIDICLSSESCNWGFVNTGNGCFTDVDGSWMRN